MTHTPARRGDLVAIESLHVLSYVRGNAETYTRVELGIVRGISRDGEVTRVQLAGAEYVHDLRKRPLGRVFVVPASMVDVAGALAMASARRYPGAPSYSTMTHPFDSVPEAREALRPFRIVAGA